MFGELDAVAFQLFGQAVGWLECAAFASGLACVWLTLRADIRNWPLGLLSVGCYAVVFVRAKLYADALLQIAFVVGGIYGWWKWARAARAADSPKGTVRVVRAGARELAAGSFVCFAGMVAVAFILARYTDSPVPAADAAVFALSLFATVLQALRRLENWWIWILVDLISIPLYWNRALYLTMVLYMVFLVLCIGGLRHWKSMLDAQGGHT